LLFEWFMGIIFCLLRLEKKSKVFFGRTSFNALILYIIELEGFLLWLLFWDVVECNNLPLKNKIINFLNYCK
jgi:hypothetical protein